MINPDYVNTTGIPQPQSGASIPSASCGKFTLPLDPLSPSLSVLALDLEGVHDVKLHHPSSSVATSNQ